MRYDVYIAAHHGGQPTRLEHDTDEDLQPSHYIDADGITYQVVSVRPLSPDENDDFDAIVEANWCAGPTQAYHTQ
jgi:hypothetical protein